MPSAGAHVVARLSATAATGIDPEVSDPIAATVVDAAAVQRSTRTRPTGGKPLPRGSDSIANLPWQRVS